MNILHIAYSLEESSAATRIAKTQESRHDVYFLLGRLSKYDYVRRRQIYPLMYCLLGISLHLLEISLFYLFRIKKNEIFSFGLFCGLQKFLLNKLIKIKKIKIIHLHWGGYGFLPLAALNNLSIPVVITAHDYGLFTGGCHVPMDCSQYDEECNSCPLSDSNLGQKIIHKNRLSKFQSLNKIKNMVVTTPSEYTKNKIKNLYPFLDLRVVGNTAGHKYSDQKINKKITYLKARTSLKSIPTIITVGVNWATRQNKGQDILRRMLIKLENEGIKFKLISIGGYFKYDGISQQLNLNNIDQESLRKFYITSDLCLVTSRYETFSQVTLESILCGTPVVAFDNSGPKDIILNKQTGFLASAFNEDEFYQLIKNNLNYKFENIERISNASEITRKKYSDSLIAQEYEHVYKLAINHSKRYEKN